MITILLNEKELSVSEGKTILEVCNDVGLSIPTFCHDERMHPDGACRVCMVEVDRKMMPACGTVVTQDMKITTDSPQIFSLRKRLLETILSDHNVACLQCEKAGACKLQDYAYEYGVDIDKYAGRKSASGYVSSNKFFYLDQSKCILCGKCARICTQLQGNNVWAFENRGFDTEMNTPFGIDMEEGNCVSCGNCVSNCPVGALMPKFTGDKFRTWEVTKTRTTCPHCGVGCQFILLVKNNRIVGVEPADGPSNRGLLCVKGKYGSYKFVHAPDRLTYPLIKKDGKFEKASWDEALDLIVEKFRAIKAEYSPDALAGFSCSRAPNEDNYVFQKMVRAAFGTNNVDNCARVCHSASVHGLAMTLGSGAMTNPIRDITQNIDVILLIGSNPTEAHPVVGAQIKQALQRGTKLIVVDPRKIELAEYADIHLPIRPGTNVAFANGMMHIIIKEGLADEEFIKSRTEGYEEIAKIVEEYTPQIVGKICNIDPEDLYCAAVMYAAADKAPIIYCLGVSEHSTGTEGVMSLSNVALLVGKLGRSGCGINPLRGQNNVQGACDMGCLPDRFPGYQAAADPDVVEKFEKAWGVELSRTTGLTATQVLPAALEGKIKGLYIFGEDQVVTDPHTEHVRECLNSLDFLVVQDLFMTETAELADVVLPGVSYAEKEGTFSNTERRVQRVRKAVQLDGEMRLDTDIVCDIMTRMGYPCHYENAAEIMDEIASVTPLFGGISHARLDAGESLQWPCPDKNHKGTYILHKDKFTRGLGWFFPAVFKEPNELPDDEFPLTMVTGRMLYHYNARAMTGRTEGLGAIAPSSYLEIHVKDASALSVKNGDRVRVWSRRGEIETTARVAEKTNPGEVFMTFHFPDGNVNKLTNPVTDEYARIPEYKVCTVNVSKA